MQSISETSVNDDLENMFQMRTGEPAVSGFIRIKFVLKAEIETAEACYA